MRRAATPPHQGEAGLSVAVAIEDLAVRIGEAHILSDVTLEVAPGEFLTLLGPSGSGKTTTLNVLAGFVKPTSGHLTIGGTVVDDLPPHRRNIGFVFQNYALFPHMTAAENIAYPLAARRVPRRDQKRLVKEALELVQLPHMAERSLRSLSGGQLQRVALARALIFEPSLLLLDEPLAALDKQLREAMQLELRRIHKRTGMTTIGVTHDQVEAMTMSDRVAILDAGRVSQVGTPEDVYQRPANLFVAAFLGEANLLPVSDGTVSALHVDAAEVHEGTAVIRPEDLELGGADESGVRATVRDVAFQGSRLRVAASLEGRERIVISTRATERLAGLDTGATVVVRSTRVTVHAIPGVAAPKMTEAPAASV